MTLLIAILPFLTMICGMGAIVSMMVGTGQLVDVDELLVDEKLASARPQGIPGNLESRMAIWLDDAELSISPRSALIGGLVPMWFGVCGFIFALPISWTLGLIILPTLIAGLALAFRRRQRLNLFREQLPEAVSVLARSTHAGLSIDQAVIVAEETLTGRIGREFRICRQQLQIGSSLGNAFLAMATRTRSPDVSFLAVILLVHREAGGKLAETLERLSVVLQDNLTMRRQLLAATSAGRFATKILIPFGPGLFIVMSILHPQHTAKFFSSPLGWTVFWTGLVIDFVGILWVVSLTQKD